MSEVAVLDQQVIARKIRRELDLRNWNVLQFYRELSGAVGQTTLYKIVNGEVMPTLPSLAAIANVLGTTIDNLISEAE